MKEIHYLQRGNEIVILTISKYNNRVVILDLKSRKKVLEKRIRTNIAEHYKDAYNWITPETAKRELNDNNMIDFLLPTQLKLFQQTTIEL